MGNVYLFADYVDNLFKSHRAEPDEQKRSFYFFWGSVYAIQFLVLPVTTLLSFLIAAWIRSKAMFIITYATHFVLLAALVLGLGLERTHPAFCMHDSVLAETFGMTSDLMHGHSEMNEHKHS